MNNSSSISVILIGVCLLVQSVDAQMIQNIKQFLEQCPTNDSAYAQIRNDFQIRRNGVRVGSITCLEPISQIPIAQYSDELIVLQALRVLYYMDRGMTGHLSWTSSTLYDWMKSRIGGVDIRDGVVGGYCCEQLDGKTLFVIGSQNDFNRDFDRTWNGTANNIDFYAHEVRHVDGFPHTSCCGITGGCDSVFSQSNPSAYAVQWILNKLWLTGEINVGYGCLSESERNDIADWHLGSCNSQFRSRFCVNLPPLLSLPSNPGGLCPQATVVELFQKPRAPLPIELKQAFPNPFNPATTIEFSLSRSSFVTLKVLNFLGQDVATLVSQELDPGTYTAHWKPDNAATGVYFCRLQAGSLSETKKLVLLR